MNKRILLINDYRSGGGAEVVTNRLVHLLRDKVEAVALHVGAESLEESRRNPFGYIWSAAQYRKLLAVLETFRPDIIHIVNYYHELSPSALTAVSRYRRKTGARVIHSAHDYHLLAPNSGLRSFDREGNSHREPPKRADRSWWRKRWDHRGAVYDGLKKVQWGAAYKLARWDRVFDVLVAPSEFMAGALATAFRNKEIRVIRNPVPEESFRKWGSVEGARSGFRRRFVYAGRLDPEKGMRAWLERLPEDAFENSTMTIVGDGPEQPAIAEVVGRRGWDDCFNFVGRLDHDDALQEIAKGDVLVMASTWYENAPLVIAEAALYGLDLLLPGYGGMKEIGELCRGAVFFDPEDDASVQSSWNRITKGPVGRLNEVRNNVLHEFSVETFVHRHLEIYSD